MTRRIAWVLSVAVASLAARGSLAVSVTAQGTAVSKIAPNGNIVLVGTGTGSGECTVEAGRIACSDGSSIATAELTQGCAATEGSGYCLIAPGDSLNVAAAGSTTDITCGSGSKKGRI